MHNPPAHIKCFFFVLYDHFLFNCGAMVVKVNYCMLIALTFNYNCNWVACHSTPSIRDKITQTKNSPPLLQWRQKWTSLFLPHYHVQQLQFMSLTTTWPWQLIRSNLIRKTRWRRSATLCWRQRHESTLSTSISAPKLIGYEIRHLLLCCIPLQLYLCAVSCPPPPAIHFDPISGLSSATPPQHMAFNLLLRPGIWKSSSHFRQPWTLRFFCRYVHGIYYPLRIQ